MKVYKLSAPGKYLPAMIFIRFGLTGRWITAWSDVAYINGQDCKRGQYLKSGGKSWFLFEVHGEVLEEREEVCL